MESTMSHIHNNEYLSEESLLQNGDRSHHLLPFPDCLFSLDDHIHPIRLVCKQQRCTVCFFSEPFSRFRVRPRQGSQQTILWTISTGCFTFMLMMIEIFDYRTSPSFLFVQIVQTGGTV